MSYGNRNAGSRVSLRKLSTYNSKGCATTYTLIIDVGKDRTRAEELRARVEEACREILEPAASLSVSPVPSERARENFRELLDEFQGFCEEACRVIWQVPTSEYPRLDTRQEVRELRNRNAARDRLISKFDETLAAVSPVPEPSEPEPNYFICCFTPVNEGHDPQCIHASTETKQGEKGK